MDRDERGLVRRCLQGNQDACTELVQKFAPLVGTVIWRATANGEVVEDLAQETFLRLFRGLPYFDARSKLSTWIYTIAHRVAVDHLRQAGRWRETASQDEGVDALDNVVAAGESPEAALAQQEMHQLVREHLSELPDKYRLPLVYAAIEGLDYEAIGTAIGVPAGTVKTLVFRGKQMLRTRVIAALGARCKV